jgi:hypothetical protein
MDAHGHSITETLVVPVPLGDAEPVNLGLTELIHEHGNAEQLHPHPDRIVAGLNVKFGPSYEVIGR